MTKQEKIDQILQEIALKSCNQTSGCNKCGFKPTCSAYKNSVVFTDILKSTIDNVFCMIESKCLKYRRVGEGATIDFDEEAYDEVKELFQITERPQLTMSVKDIELILWACENKFSALEEDFYFDLENLLKRIKRNDLLDRLQNLQQFVYRRSN